MRAHDDARPADAADAPRQMGKWAHRYAQNRSLGVVVLLAISVSLCLLIGGASLLGGMAYRAGHLWLFGLCLVIYVPAMLATIWFAVPRWGGRFAVRVTQRLYADEGNAQIVTPASPLRRWLGGLLAGVFAACIVASIALEGLGMIPHQYQQPVSALFCVPFLVGLWFLMRPAVGPITLLWPALYALHAVLILAGVPIRFTGYWDALNVLVPIAGYGFLAGLLSHLYSRYALRKLRRLSGESSEVVSAGGRS